jgi:hypothetical protein
MVTALTFNFFSHDDFEWDAYKNLSNFWVWIKAVIKTDIYLSEYLMSRLF